MDEILNKSITDMAGIRFVCSCGRRHSVDIRRILVGRNIEAAAAEIVGDFARGTGNSASRDGDRSRGTVLVIADENTYAVYGRKLEGFLADKGQSIKTFVFAGAEPLVPDERALGRLLLEADVEVSLILAAGSGSLNDLARMISARLKIPYIIAGTAPSMDGYASTVSPLIVGGMKVTYGAVYPAAILADVEVMKDAPMEMIRAGFGDVMGKYTALADWELSRRKNGEYWCETSARLVRDALSKCAESAEGMAERSEAAIGYLIEALILTGVAMGLVGNSRPASGAEHHLAHYWEVDALSKGEEHPLHGNSVGVGTVISAGIYELMAEELPEGFEKPELKQILELLRQAGAHVSPKTLGIEREVFRQSVLHAMEIRDRYTILSLAKEKGKLAGIADILTERFYG